jgi:hypothetical protein
LSLREAEPVPPSFQFRAVHWFIEDFIRSEYWGKLPRVRRVDRVRLRSVRRP